jgi:DNA repair protein RecO (recombination protein O)
MLETAERFTPVEKEPAIRQFLLLIAGLRALGDAIDPGATVSGQAPADGSGPGEPGDKGELADPGDPGGDAARSTPDDLESGPDDQESGAERAATAGAGEPAAEPRDPRMVLDAYFLRSLTFAGYAPALEECARCGTPGAARPLVAFAVATGGMVCAGCRPPGSASPAPQTAALMVLLLRGDWDKAMRSERRHRVECSGLVAAYLQWHLEHSIRSLRHVERA